MKKFLLIIATSLIVTGCASLKNTDQTQIPKTNEKEETIKHYNYRDKIIEKKFSQQNKVLGNIEKFA